MKTNKQTRLAAKQLFRACMVDGALDEGRVREVVQKVAEMKPRGYLAILSQFQRLVKLDVERRTARVETAVPLPPDLQSKVQSDLGSLYGSGLNLTFTQNPALIGGMRIKVGSDVYDGSIQERLRVLEKSF